MLGRGCKIVATLGPASDSPELLAMLIEAGASCFRLNFSHGQAEEHRRRLDAIRAAERACQRRVGVLADLQGPKLRVSDAPEGGIALPFGAVVRLEASSEPCAPDLIRAPHPELLAALQPGDVVKFDDGRLQVRVLERRGAMLEARVEIGGVLTSRKGMNVPGRVLPIPALTEKDRADLQLALELGVDFIGLSFVQRPEDVMEARALAQGRAALIAKIEKPMALEKLDDIIALADGVMVARGDLGVELDPELVPIAQRRIVRAARQAGKPVIVATQMLESMIENPAPTRAEASDVATAVYQGADAVMLSAESAVGRHPVTAVAIMDRIIRAVEHDPEHWRGVQRDLDDPEPSTADAIAHSARRISEVLHCTAIVAYTSSGSTALRIARERPSCGLIALTPHERTARRLALSWGVTAAVGEEAQALEDMVDSAVEAARKQGAAGAGERIIVIAGIPPGRPGKTNTLRIVRVDEA